ncbi:MAG: coproporphyrinogen III oxidase, partial [Spirosomataceae bacterium]
EKERIEIALEDMQNDGILEQFNGFVRVTEIGKPFLRNICMVFDPSLHQNTKTERLFSATI